MKNVPILPNLFTTGNLFCGAYSMVLAINGKIVPASWCILIAIIFDLLDGQIARLKNMSSKFGMEYDSLADLISFGAAPAVMAYMIYLKQLGRMGTALFFIYIACTALRLARFNSQKASGEKVSFSGLPTPASSGFIASAFIMQNKYTTDVLGQFFPIIMLIISALMVSSFTYPAWGMLNLWKKGPFINLVALILCGTMVFLHPEMFLFICFSVYVMSGLMGLKRVAAQLSVKNFTPLEDDGRQV